jgi:hypothetical protein
LISRSKTGAPLTSNRSGKKRNAQEAVFLSTNIPRLKEANASPPKNYTEQEIEKKLPTATSISIERQLKIAALTIGVPIAGLSEETESRFPHGNIRSKSSKFPQVHRVPGNEQTKLRRVPGCSKDSKSRLELVKPIRQDRRLHRVLANAIPRRAKKTSKQVQQ